MVLMGGNRDSPGAAKVDLEARAAAAALHLRNGTER